MVPEVALHVEIWWEIGGELAQIRQNSTSIPPKSLSA